MFELVDSINDAPVIKLVGVGGGGSNAVQHMVNSGIEGVDFICANTDAQALKGMAAQTVLHIGQSITKGLGAGANPEIGRQAAMEDRERIQDLIDGTDMLFITAGMGGGTGTGAIPVVAQIAREMGVLTVAVVTKPFPFEGAKRMRTAEAGIEELRGHVDSLITIPNEKLLSVLGKNISLLDAFRAANDVLRGAVQGIAELITNPGLINVDFADVRTVMSEMGLAMMGSGIGRGDDRATEAAEMAISSPLLEDIDLAGARGILVNITAGLDMAIGEFEEVGNVVFVNSQQMMQLWLSVQPLMKRSKVSLESRSWRLVLARNRRRSCVLFSRRSRAELLLQVVARSMAVLNTVLVHRLVQRAERRRVPRMRIMKNQLLFAKLHVEMLRVQVMALRDKVLGTTVTMWNTSIFRHFYAVKPTKKGLHVWKLCAGHVIIQ